MPHTLKCMGLTHHQLYSLSNQFKSYGTALAHLLLWPEFSSSNLNCVPNTDRFFLTCVVTLNQWYDRLRM